MEQRVLGKWTLGAIGAYRYTGDSGLYAKIGKSVGDIIATQTPDGYIGNYAPEYQTKKWDIWGQKYTMLGLLGWYELTGDRRALDAAAGVADHLLSLVGPGKINVVRTGDYRGMPSSTVLEPIMILYKFAESLGQSQHIDYFIFGHFHTWVNLKLPCGANFRMVKDWFRSSSYIVWDGESLTDVSD